MTSLPVTNAVDCWNRIGVWGDRSCPELVGAVHCHNCPVFTAAGRRFLDGRPPEGYLDEWTSRLAEPAEEQIGDRQGVLVFRVGVEWLALPVGVLREVLPLRPVHRIPFHGGALAGLVNVRGELHLAIRMDHLLGIPAAGEAKGTVPRLVVVGEGGETWAFRADEVERVHRLPAEALASAPPTVGRAATRFSRGVFRCKSRAVGVLDSGRLFEALRASVR